MDDLTLKEEIIIGLNEYLTDSVDALMLGVLANRAITAFTEYRRYPKHWTAEQIEADLKKHKSCISDLALYESIQMGAEFQSMHIESGLYRMWHTKGSIYTQHGVVPFAAV